MKISSSQLSFNAERQYQESRISKRDVKMVEDRGTLSQSILSVPVKNRLTIPSKLFDSKTDVPQASPNDEVPSDPKLAAMKRLLDALMGKKLKLTDISGFQGGKQLQQSNSQSSSSANITPMSNSQNIELIEPPARQFRITDFQSYYESEATKFNAFGSVKTDSGESINFKLNLNMKREFYSESTTQTIGDVTLMDPLVINFHDQPAELSDVKFKFDLNSDGAEEDISWLSSGSGFLVFDKNEDGVVNNGSEMFGAATNNGFKELSELDDDKNGWIDENDAAFEKLSIWSGDTRENAKLKSIKESGVGAIALESAETEFTIKEQNSQNTLGQIRRTGIYLEENGKVGTVQQLDLAI